MVSCLVIIHVAYFYNALNILLSAVKWALVNFFDWFSYNVIFHMINIICKLIYMALVIRSLLLLISEQVICHVNVFIWYSWYLIHEITNFWMAVWEFKTICTTHIMYIMHLNAIIVTLRRSKCIQYIMLTIWTIQWAIHLSLLLIHFTRVDIHYGNPFIRYR